MKVYPVIHYSGDEIKTINEAIIAKRSGADGVFFISHIGKDEQLIQIAIEVKEILGFKVGINLLPYDTLQTANIAKTHNIDMIWFDNCGVSSIGLNEEGLLLKKFAEENKNIEIFASVAFKYQPEEIDPVLAAQNALNAGFIPTTSGSRTGNAPSIVKIKDMFNQTKVLAVASGMTVENVNDFKNNLSHILVSTGVSKDEFSFDEEKLKEFIIKAKL